MLIYDLIHRHVWRSTDSHLQITAIGLVTGWTELQTHALALDLRVNMWLSLLFNCLRNLWLSSQSLGEHCTVCCRKVLFLLAWLDYCMQEKKKGSILMAEWSWGKARRWWHLRRRWSGWVEKKQIAYMRLSFCIMMFLKHLGKHILFAKVLNVSKFSA